jgi:hypothetical protein
LIGNTSGGLTKNTLSAGTGISITNGNGIITITNTLPDAGVTSLTGTANQVLVNNTSGTAETGAITLTLGTIGIVNGGTNITSNWRFGVCFGNDYIV